MAQLYTKVKLYLEANSKTWEAEQDNIILQNDGSGDYINIWNVSGLSKPTDTELNSYEDAANIEETNLQTEIENKETKKASGKQKLLDLGLTEEEAKALIGV